MKENTYNHEIDRYNNSKKKRYVERATLAVEKKNYELFKTNYQAVPLNMKIAMKATLKAVDDSTGSKRLDVLKRFEKKCGIKIRRVKVPKHIVPKHIVPRSNTQLRRPKFYRKKDFPVRKMSPERIETPPIIPQQTESVEMPPEDVEMPTEGVFEIM